MVPQAAVAAVRRALCDGFVALSWQRPRARCAQRQPSL